MVMDSNIFLIFTPKPRGNDPIYLRMFLRWVGKKHHLDEFDLSLLQILRENVEMIGMMHTDDAHHSVCWRMIVDSLNSVHCKAILNGIRNNTSS